MTLAGRPLAVAVTAFVALVCAPSLAFADIGLSFDPHNGTVLPGDAIFVNLDALIDGGDAIVAFGLSVNFDATVLHPVGVTLNSALFPDPQLPADLRTPGVISMVGFVPFGDPPVSGNIMLATLEFLARQRGVTNLTISFSAPLEGFALADPVGAVVTPDAAHVGSAVITAVPEPSGVALLMAVGGLFVSRSRRARRTRYPERD